VLFPTFTPADDVLSTLRYKLSSAENITIKTGCEATKISPQSVTLASGEELKCDAVVIATGFTLFDARIKEEYGYGIYDNVVTSADLEQMFNKGEVRLTSGETPRRIAILHCVGSRDEKVCQRHCSKVCCVTGVKQAIELKKLFPAADVFNFYMDIRMFGPGYEEMYREAQMNYNIHFVRGRISEVSPTINNRLQIKAEDTLTGRPLKLGVDMLVLLVGMRSNDMNATLEAESGLKCQPSGFMQPKDSFAGNVESNVEGIFYAGAITAPKNVGESINEGTAAAMAAAEWLAKR
jgi:heterodisulfide reductase subunit A